MTVVPLPLTTDVDFRYDGDALLRAAAEAHCDTLLLANPQNPSGILLPATEMRALLSRAEQAGLRVLIDEAFIDYVPQQSVTPEVQGATNLVIFRSVTKFFSVPGLRVAFAVSNTAWAEEIRRLLAPGRSPLWPPRAVICGLADTAFADASRTHNHLRRTAMETALRAMGLHVFPGQANFLLFSVPNGETLRARMITRHGIVLRSCANYEGLDATYYRTAVRTEPENRRLLEALACELKS